ncbi:MAG TPA: hypothetical protein VNI84_13865 [Pyrinomonadaceae bacterium]|nr:hypothetical protein [Pyrinomonadaceae bacterium]
MLTVAKELEIRRWLTAKISLADNVGTGISEPVYFESKEDFAGQMGIVVDANTDEQNAVAFENLLCDFVMTSYVRFDDTGKGTRSCPVMVVTYEFLVFQEFQRGLENKTNAHNRHIATVLQVWTKFLTERQLQPDPVVRHLDLVQTGATVKNRATEFLPGVEGFYTTLQTKVEVA